MKTKMIVIAISLAISTGILFLNTSDEKTVSVGTNEKTNIEDSNNTTSSAHSTTNKSATPTGLEPTEEQLRKKATITQTEPELPTQIAEQRKKLKNELHELLNCHKTNTCPVDNSDPRASDLLLGQQITAKLDEYTALALENDYFDDATAELVNEFISNSDGFVQESAINLMSAMPPNTENAQTLINTLATSYDAKIMKQSMKELLRYPELSSQADQLYQQSLQTGSFYVAQEIAMNILPQLTRNNIAQYTLVAQNLPQNSKRADALWSNINEFNLRQKGG